MREPTHDELLRFARKVLNRIKAALEKNGTFAPAAILIRGIEDDGTVIHEAIELPGAVMNSARLKSAAFKLIALAARKIMAVAVLMATDGLGLDMDEEHKKSAATSEEFDRLSATVGIPGLEAAGWGTAYEQVIVTIQTRTSTVSMFQRYDRVGSGRAILFVGEPFVLDSTKIADLKPVGRLFEFFDGDEDEASNE